MRKTRHNASAAFRHTITAAQRAALKKAQAASAAKRRGITKVHFSGVKAVGYKAGSRVFPTKRSALKHLDSIIKGASR